MVRSELSLKPSSCKASMAIARKTTAWKMSRKILGSRLRNTLPKSQSTTRRKLTRARAANSSTTMAIMAPREGGPCPTENERSATRIWATSSSTGAFSAPRSRRGNRTSPNNSIATVQTNAAP